MCPERPACQYALKDQSFVQKGHRDFLKQFGRQDIKDPEELKEKGDMHKASSKLMAKVKRMAGPLPSYRLSSRQTECMLLSYRRL